MTSPSAKRYPKKLSTRLSPLSSSYYPSLLRSPSTTITRLLFPTTLATLIVCSLTTFRAPITAQLQLQARTIPVKLSPSHPTNLFLPLDLWERMVHVSTALVSLTNLALVANFTLIEPFVYESKVIIHHSFPEHFLANNLHPQPASLYYDTTPLCATNRFISHAALRNLTTLHLPSNPTQKHIIHAALFFLWPDLSLPTVPSLNPPPNTTSHRPYFWCDDLLPARGHRRTHLGHEIIPNRVYLLRALCMKPPVHPLPSNFFDELFAYVRKNTSLQNIACPSCVTIAFFNYRKHVFNSYSRPHRPPVTLGVLRPGLAGQRIAQRIRSTVFDDAPVVAIQMRSGKLFDVLNKYQMKNPHSTPGADELFAMWLDYAVGRLIAAAREAARELDDAGGKKARFYVASDLYNSGWKGGERCTVKSCATLEKVRERLQSELEGMYHFVPEEFDVTQDVMGMSGAVDAAVCYLAKRFVFVTPSNLGKWVAVQRRIDGRGNETRMVDGIEGADEKVQRIWDARLRVKTLVV